MEDDQVDHIDHGADAGESKKKVIGGIMKEHEYGNEARAEGAKPRHCVRRPNQFVMAKKEDQIEK